MLRDVLLLVLGAALAAATLLLARRVSRRPVATCTDASARASVAPVQANAVEQTQCAESQIPTITVVDEDGNVVFVRWEGAGFTARWERLPPNESAIRHASQFAADLLKGAATLPSRTLEVVFKPDIQQGLRDGAYTLMKTQSGETLADAVDRTGQIVGKGRLMEAGKMRQLAAGAFQLASIAVAQAHLADIERSLQGIRGDLEKVLQSLESADRANLSGSISYLRHMAEFLKAMNAPAEMPAQMKNQIEGLVLKSHIWRDKLDGDMNNLIGRVASQSDKDRMGKSETYRAMESHLMEAEQLLQRRELLRGVFALLNIVAAWADPLRREFSRVDAAEQQWGDRLHVLRRELERQAKALFSKSLTESNDLLHLRTESIKFKAAECIRIGLDQKQRYESSMLQLESNVDLYFRSSAGMRVVLAFGEAGQVKDAALV